MRFSRLRLWLVISGIGLLATSCGSSSSSNAAAGEEVFQQRCSACHTIGNGPLVGPDLAGVTTRHDAEWLHSWITDPGAFAKTDPVAGDLFTGKMPTLGLSSKEVDSVIAYLKSAKFAQ